MQQNIEQCLKVIYRGQYCIRKYLVLLTVLLLTTNRNCIQLKSQMQMSQKLIVKTKGKNPKISSFMKDPKCDFLVLINKDIIPLHTSVLSKYSPYFQKSNRNCTNAQHQVKIITQAFNSITVISVLKYHYGQEIQIETGEQLEEIMLIARYFQFTRLIDQIIKEIYNNFDSLDLFYILTFSKIFQIPMLEKMCWDRLQVSNYEQVCSNRSNILYCQQELFEQVLRRMSEQKKLSEKQGNKTKKLVEDYNSFNEAGLTSLVDVEKILKFELAEVEEVEEIDEEEIKQNQKQESDNFLLKISKELYSSKQTVDDSQINSSDKNLSFVKMEKRFIDKYHKRRPSCSLFDLTDYIIN